jgi:multicomponent Na+:H+ antiporter subunit B
MIGAYPTVVVRVISALLSPFIAMFGLYVIAHGHYGPGGGFAGGVFVAVGAILPRLTLPEHVAYRLVPTTVGPIAGAIGMLLFLAIGLAPIAFGGPFLDYGVLAFGGMEVARARYLGILVVEVAVGLSVFGAMILLFDVLTGRAQSPAPQRRSTDAGSSPTRPEPEGRP